MRDANRSHTDVLLLAVLDTETPFDDWTYLEDLAGTELSLNQMTAAAKHLQAEYGAVEFLPLTRAVMLSAQGVDRYMAHERAYAASRLGETERTQLRFIRGGVV